MNAFIEFPKIARLSRECVITEKIDGTNASICVADDGLSFQVGSRSRWITPEDDNFGFARWAREHAEELLTLGPGNHFGEWWGAGIQRRYGLTEKRFSLFNTHRWGDDATRPACCHVVPILYTGVFDSDEILGALAHLQDNGSKAAPGFDKPEGVVIWNVAAQVYFKKMLHKDDEWKGNSKAES